ncbi:MAG: hypothetical protein RIG82_13620 [Phycisphaeraceae bacterium]
MAHQPTTSVCFLASDGVYDWAIALLESLKANSPSVRKVLIPYKDDIDRLLTAQARYDFEVMDDPRLAELERIGRLFGEHRFVRNFKKLAAFFGPCDVNVFLDADVVVLDDLTRLTTAMAEQNCQFSYFDQSRNWVYNTWSFIEKMEAEYGSGLFNSGAWAVGRNALCIERIDELTREALTLRDEMYPGYDQSVPNYCVDRGGLRPKAVADLLPEYAQSHRPLHKRMVYQDRMGSYRMKDRRSTAEGQRVMLLHWAGSGLHPFMPMRSTFLNYRLAGARPLDRLGYFSRVWSRLPGDRWNAWRKRNTYPSRQRPTPV